MGVEYFKNFYIVYVLLGLHLCNAVGVSKSNVDQAIEDEITQKLGEDLLQSVEKKFQVDLERSVNMVLTKIKLLLQNGTNQIEEKLLELQASLADIKSQAPTETEQCLLHKHNETSALAEKALHQMVVCGYALIGQDPAMAVNKILMLKNMIRQQMEPMNAQKKGIYGLLRACGHEYDTLKKVIKCVISKSPIVKSVMMEITSKLIDGVVSLTKLLAHGAMHEACLIEVVKSIEDEAAHLITRVKKCTNNEGTTNEVDDYIKENNATVLDVQRKRPEKNESENIQEILRRMLEDKDNNLDVGFKEKLLTLQSNLKAVKDDALFKDLNNID